MGDEVVISLDSEYGAEDTEIAHILVGQTLIDCTRSDGTMVASISVVNISPLIIITCCQKSSRVR